jgi:formylglycine-generating enzyme required for sulfatase activity
MGGDRYDHERPIHWVRISPFWLAETTVTNRQYAIFLDQTGHEEPGFWRDRRFSAPEQPVVAVSWHDARAFCRWLTETSGVSIVLPTEAQWEFAARGPEGREYPWGSEKPDPTRACFDQDWEKGKPAPVGSCPEGRGPFGNLDLAGNVWEWCRDAWDEQAYEKRSGKEPVDPVVERDGDPPRVLLGGGWGYEPKSLRDEEIAPVDRAAVYGAPKGKNRFTARCAPLLVPEGRPRLAQGFNPVHQGLCQPFEASPG